MEIKEQYEKEAQELQNYGREIEDARKQLEGAEKQFLARQGRLSILQEILASQESEKEAEPVKPKKKPARS